MGENCSLITTTSSEINREVVMSCLVNNHCFRSCAVSVASVTFGYVRVMSSIQLVVPFPVICKDKGDGCREHSDQRERCADRKCWWLRILGATLQHQGKEPGQRDITKNHGTLVGIRQTPGYLQKQPCHQLEQIAYYNSCELPSMTSDAQICTFHNQVQTKRTLRCKNALWRHRCVIASQRLSSRIALFAVCKGWRMMVIATRSV